jgi:ribonuclease P protein component
MLARPYRLSKQKEFQDIFARGRRFQSEYFSFLAAKNNRSISRFAVVVSAKVSKKAVARNRVRRQLNEIIRLHQQKIKPGLDMVLIVKEAAVGAKYRTLEETALKLFDKC